MKKYYFKALTDWTSRDFKEQKKILWFRYGGKKRGQLDCRFFDTSEEALNYCKYLKMIMK